MKKHIFILLILISLSSCVSNKEMIYLQNPSAETSTTAQTYKPYRIQPFDVLYINLKSTDKDLSSLFSNSETQTTNVQQVTQSQMYFTGYTVDDHGNIRIPVLGDVNILGLSIEEVRLKIEKKLLDEYFKEEANLFIDVKLAGFRFTINGEVAKTGSQVLYQDRVNILEAVANAGDITLTGNRKEVLIIRTMAHKTETISVDLTDAKLLESPHFYIQPNDYIYVKPLKQKSWGTGTTGMQTMSTIITGLSVITTTILLINNLK